MTNVRGARGSRLTEAKILAHSVHPRMASRAIFGADIGGVPTGDHL